MEESILVYEVAILGLRDLMTMMRTTKDQRRVLSLSYFISKSQTHAKTQGLGRPKRMHGSLSI